ncbi:hypothetical protein KCP78_09410 [Salmonella enterica subsp. enterica]|nr:hypothetical protein KCP78_09410 [Salmonella enterica subsp. enterica]
MSDVQARYRSRAEELDRTFGVFTATKPGISSCSTPLAPATGKAFGAPIGVPAASSSALDSVGVLMADTAP